MKFDNNLDIEKGIVEQLSDYKVAVNKFKPKDGDYHYSFAELTGDFHKGAIWGMALVLDILKNEDANHEFEHLDDKSILGQMKYEVEEEYLNNIFNTVMATMDESIVSFLDEQSCNEEINKNGKK